ncbi:MAG: FAD-dependent oxidoreductase [Burkholderiales bacterium]
MRENETVDVVVIGGGMAGLAAALAARRRNFTVALLEKADRLGGSTSYSWGFLWVAPNHLARAAGEHDDDASIRAYLEFLAGGQGDAMRMEAFISRAPEALRFFEECGIEFQLVRSFTDHYFGVAPGARKFGRTLETSLVCGDELGAWRDKILVPPAPYRVNGDEMVAWGGMNNAIHWPTATMSERSRRDMRGLGVGIVSHFLKALIKQGGAPRLGCGVRRLIVEAGRVAGVETAEGQRIMARKGVVIASGGYESNAKLVDMFEGLPGWQSQFPATLTGDGLLMAQEIGAAVRVLRANMTFFLGYTVPGDPPFFRLAGIIELFSPHTVVVNRAGQRFADEAYFQNMVPALLKFDPATHRYPNLPCFLIFDQQFVENHSVAGQAAGTPVPDWIARGETLDELARKLGIDSSGMHVTIERFNQFARAGRDEDFHRGESAWNLAKESGRETKRSLGTLERPPFYGLELHPSAVSSAGIAADEHGRAHHVRGEPIPGLYVSGNAAARTEYGAGYQLGHSLTAAMTFSYLAVRHMEETQ